MTQFVIYSKANPHLPHNSVELQSPPPPDAPNDEIAQKNAELIVGELMRGETTGARAAQPASETAPASEVAPASETIPRPPRQAGRAARPKGRRADLLPPLAPPPPPRVAARKAPAPPPAGPPRARPEPAEADLRAALTAEADIPPAPARGGPLARLRPAHGLAAVAALVALVWPVLVGALTLCLIGVALLAGVLLRRAVAGGRWQRFAQRRPGTAERLRRVADRAAARADAVLDILPARWADALALPDMSEPVARRPRSRPGQGARAL